MDARSDVEVKGTWDFKWPLGTKIRVAFQPPREKDRGFESATEVVRKIAESWIDGKADIAFDWVDVADVLEPADDTSGSVPDRSTFLPPTNNAEYRDYDILVSLDPLEALRGRLLFPKSELGSFARRIDYGVPTMFLGPLKRETSLADHFSTDLAKYAVCHEFGHALGLVHEHQNPNLTELRTKLKGQWTPDSAATLRKNVLEAWQTLHGISETDVASAGFKIDEFVKYDILEQWPGNPSFSDFRDYQPAVEAEALASVMMLLKFGSFTQTSVDGGIPQAPSEADLRQLASMYPLQPNPLSRNKPLTFVIKQ